MAPEHLLVVRWYAVVDDTIGGAAISTVDKPVSASDHRLGDVTIGNFLTMDIAEHVATLHNRTLPSLQVRIDECGGSAV